MAKRMSYLNIGDQQFKIVDEDSKYAVDAESVSRMNADAAEASSRRLADSELQNKINAQSLMNQPDYANKQFIQNITSGLMTEITSVGGWYNVSVHSPSDAANTGAVAVAIYDQLRGLITRIDTTASTSESLDEATGYVYFPEDTHFFIRATYPSGGQGYLYYCPSLNAADDASSGEQDPELLDIRVGYDGRTYDTAGDAVRGQANLLRNGMAVMGNSIALPFTTATAYTIGDYCRRDGNLYRFVADHAKNVAWNAAHVEQVTVGSELKSKSSGSSVPTAVRSAILALFESAAYAETGLSDEIALIRSWATEVTAISLSANTLSLNGSTPQTLTATVVPSSASVAWSSSDTSIATVVNGVVTGVSNGTCVIRATAGDLSATCDVTVSGFTTLVSISAVYTQSGTVYDTASLDDLKSDLVVTAHYDDSSTATISNYTLSGTLTEGTSTITVSFGGKTTTFTVTVTEAPLDTTVQLDTAHMNQGQSNTVGSYSNKTGFCPSISYPVATTLASGYDYLCGIIPVDEVAAHTCKAWLYYQDNTAEPYTGNGSGKPMQVYSESMTQGRIGFQVSKNVVSFTIPVHVDYLDDSYLYVQSTGNVLFAGKNTPYYGMSNISEVNA